MQKVTEFFRSAAIKVVRAVKVVKEVYLNRYMTNTCVYLDGAGNGKEVLHNILTELQKRITATKTDDVSSEATVMAVAVGKEIELAYSDFKAFSEKWELRVYYNTHPNISNIFVFYFFEKQGHRQLHFRFTGLKNNNTEQSRVFAPCKAFDGGATV